MTGINRLLAQHKLTIDLIGKQIEAGQDLTQQLINNSFACAEHIIKKIDIDLKRTRDDVSDLINPCDGDCDECDEQPDSHNNTIDSINAALDALIDALKGSK